MKPYRSQFKTFLLLIVRYERWSANPKNVEKVILMNMYNNKTGVL